MWSEATTPEFVHSVRHFFALAPSFDASQLVTRAPTGKLIVMVAHPVLRLLNSDASRKLRLINTGVRVLQKIDAHSPPRPANFKLAQEVVPALLPHMGAQRIFASESEVRLLLTRRNVRSDDFGRPAIKQAIARTAAGPAVVVFDARGSEAVDAAAPPPLAFAVTRTTGGTLRLVVKKEEAASLLRRLEFIATVTATPAD